MQNMKNVLTFVIPVRHQENARNWSRLSENLKQTIASIANQDIAGWKAVIVANFGAALPEIPEKFEIKRVDFPPNRLHERGNATQEEFHEAVRADKGRRVLAGMLHAGEMGHVMIVDDDDFVSRRLTAFVAANRNMNGWYIKHGYVWAEGTKLLYRLRNFSEVCGTSLIVRADLYNLPKSIEAADETYIRRMLGSHIQIKDILSKANAPLSPLPFNGAVYRTGHAESHSQSSAILKQYFFNNAAIRQPHRTLARALRLRLKTSQMNREFFGGVP
jgi:hypothetical protein